MEIEGARVLVTGATGVLGSGLAEALYQEGASLALAGRDAARLAQQAARCADAPTLEFEAGDLDRCGELGGEAFHALGGLDAVLVAHGVAAFARVGDENDADNEYVMLVNALAPMALLRGSVPYLSSGGVLAAVSAVLVDAPTAHMAAYTASKAALSGWLGAVRGEVRRDNIAVLDIRAPHMDTGLVERAIAGEPPRVLPRPFDLHAFFAAAVQAMGDKSAVLSYDSKDGHLVSR